MMTLVVETGSGVANADSYVSVDMADNYHLAFGNNAWTGDLVDKESALRRATRYIDSRFRTRLPGFRTYSVQALEWPRKHVVLAGNVGLPIYSIPNELQAAVYEVALIELTVPGGMTPTVLPSDQVASEKVGPLEVVYRTTGSALRDATPVNAIIESLLSALLKQSGSTRFIARA